MCEDKTAIPVSQALLRKAFASFEAEYYRLDTEAHGLMAKWYDKDSKQSVRSLLRL